MDLEQVGLYAVLIGIVGLFGKFIQAYDSAIKPVLYQALKDDNENTGRTLNSMYSSYAAIGICSLAAILLAGSHMHLITDSEKYLSIVDYFSFAILAMIPLILVKYEILVILFYKKTFLLSVITIFKTIAMIVLMVLLIPEYGIKGAIGLSLIHI